MQHLLLKIYYATFIMQHLLCNILWYYATVAEQRPSGGRNLHLMGTSCFTSKLVFDAVFAYYKYSGLEGQARN